MIIDLSRISYANWPALEVLMSASLVWRKAYLTDCVAIAGANANVRRSMKLLGIERFFIMANSVAEAREALSASVPSEPVRESGTKPASKHGVR